MAAAIRERRILSLRYSRAIEPQLFAPLALYVSNTNRPMVDGYEVNGQRVRWRELELEVVRDVRSTEHTYVLTEGPASIRKRYPDDVSIIALVM
jgi:hypothetical protein